MKARVLTAALVWGLLISLLHVQLNVGWARVGALFSGRRELIVGFLPVT